MRCSICHARLAAQDQTTQCPECRQVYHRTCWDGIGGCATYGCSAAAQPQKPAPPPVTYGGWGDTKPCPACKQVISSSLLVCRCGASFPYADPMTPEEFAAWRAEEQQRKAARRLLLALFFVGLTGFLAPLCGGIAVVYAWRRRRLLAGTGGIYLAVGFGAGAIGFVYTLAILLLLLGG